MDSLYPTTQADLDIHHKSKFPSRNHGPFLTEIQATSLLKAHNDPSRKRSREETAAITRLHNAETNCSSTYNYGPERAIRAFSDLDTIFFASRLRGNVILSWFHCATIERHNCCYGFTECPRPPERAQTRIRLNEGKIFVGTGEEGPFRLMFSTLLHEMCHAYDYVVCPGAKPVGGDGAGHGVHFKIRIQAVDESAGRILGLAAIDGWDVFMQHYLFVGADDEGGKGEVVATVGGSGEGGSDGSDGSDGRKGYWWGFNGLPSFDNLLRR